MNQRIVDGDDILSIATDSKQRPYQETLARLKAALLAAGIVRRPRDGVRLLSDGELTSAVTFEIEGASKAAIAAVEKAGGSVVITGAAQDAPQE